MNRMTTGALKEKVPWLTDEKIDLLAKHGIIKVIDAGAENPFVQDSIALRTIMNMQEEPDLSALGKRGLGPFKHKKLTKINNIIVSVTPEEYVYTTEPDGTVISWRTIPEAVEYCNQNVGYRKNRVQGGERAHYIRMTPSEAEFTLSYLPVEKRWIKKYSILYKTLSKLMRKKTL